MTCSGTTGGRSSTAAASTAPPRSSASPPTQARPSGWWAAPWSGTPDNGSKGSSPSWGSPPATPWSTPSRSRSTPARSAKPYRCSPTPHQLAWRNRFYDLITDSRLEAIIAFGGNAQAALRLWDNAPDVPTFKIPHPSAHNGADLAAKWAAAIPDARAAVTPDPGGDQTGPNYGTGITEADYAPIPYADLPYGQPIWIGNDKWGRTDSPRHNNTIERSSDDPDHKMTWQAPQP